MKLSNKAEEILETLWVSSEEKGEILTEFDRLNTSEEDPTFQELLKLGYISISQGKVKLEEKGREKARAAIRCHRLAERLMVDVLNIGDKIMNQQACLFEHLLHEDVEESVCTLLGHPQECPHGKPIPPGHCCIKAKKQLESVIQPLTKLTPGKKGAIAYISTGDNKILQKLIVMGALPGISIKLIQKFPSYVFQIGQTQIAVDEEMARNIFIRLGKK